MAEPTWIPLPEAGGQSKQSEVPEESFPQKSFEKYIVSSSPQGFPSPRATESSRDTTKPLACCFMGAVSGFLIIPAGSTA